MEKLNLNPDTHVAPVPEDTAFDHAITAAPLLSVATAPVLGPEAALILGSATAFFRDLIAPLRKKRLEGWLEELRQKVNELSQKVDGFTWERLVEDEEFVSALSQAAEAAVRTHDSEKREALRNALLNVAAGTAPEGDTQAIFLTFVDAFTPTHIRILAMFHGDGDRSPFKDLQRELTDQAIRDLRDRGLLRDGRAYIAQSRETTDALIFGPWELTRFGHQFLTFISSPLDKS